MKNNLYIVCLFLLAFAGDGYCRDIRLNAASEIIIGPKLRLDYQPEAAFTNPVHSFMYFVPLTSPTSVSIVTDPETTFAASITSWKTTEKGNTIHVECDFEVTGQGGYCASYNSEEMIRLSLSRKHKKNVKEMKELLEWIRLDGPCLGRIEGYGHRVNGNIQMKNIEISFNRNNSKSPILVSIYDIPSVNGAFLFENRTNCQIARINSLTFNCDDHENPNMGVVLASVTKSTKEEGLLSRLTAIIANILSTSAPVSPAGNMAMMDFGAALYHKKPVFTFPAARNIESN